MTNASRHCVKEFETIIGFDNTGEVVYSVTGTFGTLGTLREHEELQLFRNDFWRYSVCLR